MKFQYLSNQKLYLNETQHQIYTASKIKKVIQKWANDFSKGKSSSELFKRLFESHFSNLTELPKYEIIQNKKHSTQCSYAIECSCICWCKGKYHGRLITQEIHSNGN